MKNVLRHICAVLVILPVVLPLLFAIQVSLQRSSIFHEMKEKLEEEQLVSISINKDEVVWVKPGKEISYKGHMFDVEEYKEQNGKMYFTGLFDEKESDLNELVNRQMKKTDNQQYKLLHQLFQLLQNSHPQNDTGTDIFFESKALVFRSYADGLINCELPILLPPPKC